MLINLPLFSGIICLDGDSIRNPGSIKQKDISLENWEMSFSLSTYTYNLMLRPSDILSPDAYNAINLCIIAAHSARAALSIGFSCPPLPVMIPFATAHCMLSTAHVLTADASGKSSITAF